MKECQGQKASKVIQLTSKNSHNSKTLYTSIKVKKQRSNSKILFFTLILKVKVANTLLQRKIIKTTLLKINRMSKLEFSVKKKKAHALRWQSC